MEGLVLELRPDIRKTFVSFGIILGIIIIGLTGMLLFLNSIVGLQVFLDVFSEFGIPVSGLSLVFWMYGVIAGSGGLIVLFDYMMLKHERYDFYTDRLIFTKAKGLGKEEEELPYGNITSVTFAKQAFPKPDKVILHITGKPYDKVEMKNLDGPGEIVGKLQSILHEYRARYYAKYGHEYRMQNIMEAL
ncbi:PH domain-containing protein [Candidatus Woesearchaeota archaeon]|nr:PH domain-containing protein [Candidatus Woesearchaeota archaeon]